MKRILILFLLMSSMVTVTYAQVNISDIFELRNQAEEDINTYFGDYFQPMLASTASGLANGWYNTAAPHKFPGGDITVTFNYARVPEELVNFAFNNADYSALTVSGGDGTMLPTVFGAGAGGQQLQVGSGATQLSAPAPAGLSSQLPLDIRGIPIPVAQVGIGLPKGTDLNIRYVPASASPFDALTYSMIGVGVMHDIKQWIPGMKLLPFSLSAFAAYTQMDMSFTPDLQNAVNEELRVSANALTIQALISKKLLFFTPYAGIGVNTVGGSFDMLGEYTYANGESITDPVSFEYQGSRFSPRATVGARLKLAVLTIHADYTLQDYSNLTVGLGISIR